MWIEYHEYQVSTHFFHIFAECQEETFGKGGSLPSVMSLPSVWHSAKVALPSVDSLPSVLGLALGKGCLCRVPDIWHSAKESALGIVEFPGSEASSNRQCNLRRHG